MQINRRIIGALLALLAAIELAARLASAVLVTDPAAASFTSGENSVHFASDRDRVWGRCATVRWEVAGAEGVWINGQPRDPVGSEAVCITEDFSRPQIFVIFADDQTYLDQLYVESILFTPHGALSVTAHLAGIVVLLAGAGWLAGVRAPRRVRAGLGALRAAARRADRLPDRAFYAALAGLFVIYAGVNVALVDDWPVVLAVEENYLNDQSICEVWETGLRPITVPLVFKLFSNKAEWIEPFQWAFSVLAWGVFGLALVAVLRHKALKIAGFGVMLLFSLSRDVAYWHTTLYSESLSNSLFLLLAAAALIVLRTYAHRRDRLTPRVQLALAAGLFVLTFFWSFTRDTNAYMVLLTGLALLAAAGVGAWLGRRVPARRRLVILPLLLGIGCVLIFPVQSRSADRGVRHQLPLVNLVGSRVLPYPDRTAFFTARGMPDNDRVRMYENSLAWLHGLDFSGFGDWIETDGKRVYMEFLLSQPWASATEPLENWPELWAFDDNIAEDWSGPERFPGWQEFLADAVYGEAWTLLALSAFGLLSLLLALVAGRVDERFVVPVMFLLLTYPAAFLNWHGDSFAIQRHALGLVIRWRLAMWLLLLFVADRWLSEAGHALHAPAGDQNPSQADR